MDKGKERGILKLEPNPRIVIDTNRSELTPQGSYEFAPSSPQPSVDRLSVTWAEPGSMTSSGVNLFHLPSETPVSNEVKFSPITGDGSEDEDYSASLSAVLRQRRASVRRSRKGRPRRPSSPFLPDENRPRRRSSVFTTSSGDTAISMEEAQLDLVSQEQIFENIHLHKEVLGSVKQQPLGMRRKLKIVHQAKGYIKRHEGQLQERLAQSKSTKDIYARFNILMATKWQQLKREAANTSNLLIPWELRIKKIESHFGSVVASYFTFLRWLFWVNLVIGFILLVFVIVPEYLTANPKQDGERKMIMEDEKRKATYLLILWEFEGVLKYSPIFYGYYSNLERPQYRMPLAYFLTGLAVYIYSFVAILRKMAENSRMSKLSEKEDECIFSWKLFTGWDFMIGNAETAHNRIASVILGFKEALLEEAEKKKDLRNWRIITLRALVNICVVILLAVSAYAVVYVVSSNDNPKIRSWWRENETTIVVTVISITFPVFFELLGFLEHYHPRKQLRLQLARIMLLNLLNLYSLIFALFSKIQDMSHELDSLQPNLNMNATMISNTTLNIIEPLAMKIPSSCVEEPVSCGPCNMEFTVKLTTDNMGTMKSVVSSPLPFKQSDTKNNSSVRNLKRLQTSESINPILAENLIKRPEIEITTLDSILLGFKELEKLRNITHLLQPEIIKIENDTTLYSSIEYKEEIEATTLDSISLGLKELEKLRGISLSQPSAFVPEPNDTTSETDDYEYPFYEGGTASTLDINTTPRKNDISSIETPTIEFSTASFLTESTSELESVITSENITYTDLDMTDINTDTTKMSPEISNGDIGLNNLSTELTIDVETTIYTNIETTDFIKDITKINTEVTNLNTETAITDDYYLTSDSTETTTDASFLSSSTYNALTTKVEKDHPYTNNKDINTNDNQFAVTDTTLTHLTSTTDLLSELSTVSIKDTDTLCPNVTFNCTVNCGGQNITQVFFISNCNIVSRICYVTRCEHNHKSHYLKGNETNMTTMDVAYIDDNNRKMYNLTVTTRKKLLKLCWETMFGQELVKLTMMDLVFVLLGTLFMDFFRALFVRYMNRCWCWDLEKKFPEYGDFKIAENILHLINNQGMVWMGMFFSPGLVVLNVVKLMIMMYLRSWAVMTCNVPHEVVFRVSKSNNFYLALLLTMLFLCVLPVGYTIVWVKPSWHCGPFSEYDRIYKILTNNIYKILPKSLKFTLEYIASPAIVIPLLVLLILIIYYLTSLTNSLREANNDLKIQLRRERTEERRKMFQLADTRRRAGSSAMDNTPFARWKKALPSLPMSKSIDSDDRKTITAEETMEPMKSVKKRGRIFAKIVGMALDKKSDVEAVSEVSNASPSPNNIDDETDTDFHESLPKDILKAKDITVVKLSDQRKKNSVEFTTTNDKKLKNKLHEKSLRVKLEKIDDRTEKKAIIEKQLQDSVNEGRVGSNISISIDIPEPVVNKDKKINKKQVSESSTQSKQSDSIGSVIPVITISTTESDEEILSKNDKDKKANDDKGNKKNKKSSSDLKSLRRQSSVDSINEQKIPKENKADEGHKYQYSL